MPLGNPSSVRRYTHGSPRAEPYRPAHDRVLRDMPPTDAMAERVPFAVD